MPYILRSANALDPAAAYFNPGSIFAWNVAPDESLAPISKWEEVSEAELSAVLSAAPNVSDPAAQQEKE